MKRAALIAFCLTSCLAIQPAHAVVYYDVYSTDGADTLLLGFEVDSELSYMATSPSPIFDLIGTDAAAFPQATEAENDLAAIVLPDYSHAIFASDFPAEDFEPTSGSFDVELTGDNLFVADATLVIGTTPPAVLPEPSSLALLIGAVLAGGVVRRATGNKANPVR